MYSASLKKFVDENRPNEIVISQRELAELAKGAGLAVYYHGQHPEIDVYQGDAAIVIWGEPVKKKVKKSVLPFGRHVEIDYFPNRQYLTFGIQTIVVWVSKVEGNKVSFIPCLEYRGRSSYGHSDLAPETAILDAVGVEPKTLDLPEEAVVLPRAPWDHSYVWGDFWGTVVDDTLVCFKSEAEEIVEPFIRELKILCGIEEE